MTRGRTGGALLEVVGLTKGYGDLVVLDGADLDESAPGACAATTALHDRVPDLPVVEHLRLCA